MQHDGVRAEAKRRGHLKNIDGYQDDDDAGLQLLDIRLVGAHK
jgi:hypothetical protein